MILKRPKSRIYTVNLFADFILSKIPHTEESMITVVDFKNFVVIKGRTTSNEILDINLISDKFNNQYQNNFKISHTIDLIEYGCKVSNVDTILFTLHKSENCSYHEDQIKEYLNGENSYDFNYRPIEITDDLLSVSSEFPHGHSLGQGRLLYLYGKHLFYNIPHSYPITTLTFKLSTQKNDNDETIISIYNPQTKSYDEVLKSAILDVFDFDMSELESEMKKVDWSLELTNPLKDYDFIRKINKEFIIF